MIDHVSLAVNDLQKSREFYLAALAPLGYGENISVAQAAQWGVEGCGIGEDSGMRLWLEGGGAGKKVHLAFAGTRAVVDAFYAAALAAGGTDNGVPGIREQYSPTYYAAFVYDLDGNNIEVVCRA